MPDGFDLNKLTTDQVEEIDYLNYFAKELLRIDLPVVVNFL